MTKFLVVGPSWVGDMVMSQSLFKSLRQQSPDCVIDVVAPKWSHPVLARMPEVRRAIVMPVGHGEVSLGKRYQLGKSLRSENYEQAILLPNTFKSALLPFFARIAKRTGWRGEMRYGLLNDLRVLDKSKMPLMVDRYRSLAFDKGARLPNQTPLPDLKVSPESVAELTAKFDLKQDKKTLAICPGAEFGPAKRWPETQYADLAKQMLSAGWQVWILGSPKDKDVAAQINTLCNDMCVNLAGETQLAQAIDLLSMADFVVTNDSGLMHIAAAVATPLIAIYGATDSKHTPPLGPTSRVIQSQLDCSPCHQRECPLQHHRCMKEITVDQVLSLIKESYS